MMEMWNLTAEQQDRIHHFYTPDIGIDAAVGIALEDAAALYFESFSDQPACTCDEPNPFNLPGSA